jgi:hypothetical protein
MILIRLFHQNPDYFLDELLHLLETNRFISVHTTIYREIERAGVSSKRLKRIAAERNEERRADFIRRMAHHSPEEMGFFISVAEKMLRMYVTFLTVSGISSTNYQ